MATTQRDRAATSSGITIIAPNAGQNVVLKSNGEESVHFDYDVRTSTFSRSENDLVVEGENGGKVTVVDFFAVGANNPLPNMVLEDGTVVASADFLKAQAPDMDITTAAGPAQTSSTSGLSAYDDAAGSLLGGTDRLGSLGTDQWGQSSQQPETVQNLLVAEATADAGPTPGPTPPPPPPSGPTYDARAVLFTQDATAAPMVGFAGVSVADASSITWHDAAFKDYFDVSIDANGQLTLTLNQAGKDFLAAQGGNNAYGYITLTDANGVEYTVQVVLNQSDNVASKALDAENADANGGYDLANSGLKHGEWHQGQALNNGTLSSSDLNDHIRFTGVVSGSSIDAGKGYDIVYLGGLKGSNTVVADGGSVTVEQVTPGATAYSMTTTGGSNTITAKSADVTLNASGNSGINMYAENGSNSVKTTSGDISLTAHSDINASSYGMYTKTNGSNTLEATQGSVSLDVSGEGGGYGMTNYSTVQPGTNSITAGKDIDIDVHVAKFAYGMSGQGTLKAGGDISIDATSREFGASGISSQGSTVVEAGGKLTVNASSIGAGGNAGTVGVGNGGGTLDITAKSIDIAASTKSTVVTPTQGAGVYAVSQATGTTTMTAEKDISITATKEAISSSNEGFGARGISQSGGQLDITSEYGNITIKANDNVMRSAVGAAISDGAIGIYSSGGKTNVHAEEGKVSLQVNQETTTPGSYAWGLLSTAAGADISIVAKAAAIAVNADNQARGMNAYLNGTNSITADNIELTLNGKSSSIGMLAEYSPSSDTRFTGANTLTARTATHDGTVTMNLGGGGATAMSGTSKGQNLIDADRVVINGTVSDVGTASAMSASYSATNTIKSNDVDITLKGNNTTGLSASNSSVSTEMATNLVQGTGEHATFDLNMTVIGNSIYGGTAYGMNANYGGSNTIKDFETVTITGAARANGYGLYAAGNATAQSQNTITSTGDVTLNMQSTKGIAYGAYASGGTNSLNAGGDVNIAATSNIATGTTASDGFYVPNAYGLRAEAGGKNEITKADNVTITASNPGAGFASAMDAKSGGTNSVTNVTGNVIVGGGNYGMQVDGAGSSNTIDNVDGNVTVSGTTSAMGGYRTTSGTNTISNVDGNVKLDAGATGIAMDSWYGTTNTISTVKGTVEMTGGTGMYAFGANSSNTIDGVEGNVTFQSNSGTAMYSGNSKAQNTIKNVTGNVDFQAGSSAIFGINTYSGKNTIDTVGGDVNISAGSTGIFTANSGTTTISNVAGNVNIKGQVGVDNKGATLIENVGKNVTIGSLSVQSNGGTNTVRTVDGDVTIANSMVAGAGKNEISGVQGNVFVNGGNNAYVGVSAANSGQNSIEANGNVTVQTASTSSVTYGLQANTSGTNSLSSDSAITISAKNVSSGSATGMAATNSGANTIAAGGDVKVTATSSKGGNVEATAYGLRAESGGKNEITNARNVEITAELTGTITESGAIGVDANSASNTINATETVTITAKTPADKASGSYSPQATTGVNAYVASGAAGAANTITAKNIVVNSYDNKLSRGLAAEVADATNPNAAEAKNVLTADGTISITSSVAPDTIKSATHYGVYAKGENASNTLTAKDITIAAGNGTQANINGLTYGIYNETGGKTALHSTGGDVSITAQAAAGGIAGIRLSASTLNTSRSAVSIDGAKNVTIGGTATSGNGKGIENYGGDVSVAATDSIAVSASGTTGANAVINTMKGDVALAADTVTLAATASTGVAAGITNNSGTVDITAHDVHLNIAGTTGATGMDAAYGNSDTARNTINATTVDMQVSSAKGTVYAMSANAGSATMGIKENIITADNVTIEATTGANSTAYGMYSKFGTNTIQGSTTSNGIEVRIITAAGLGGKAYAMYANGAGGVNQVLGTEKDDFVSIKGEIKAEFGGQNIIRTGAGDDRVVLDGAVNGGGLTLEMGEGYDILTLKAATFGEFKARYETWLKALMATGHGIEAIEVMYNETWSAQDKADLQNFFNDPAFVGMPVLYPESLHTGTEVHSDMGNVFHEGSFDGTLAGDGHSSHTFASTQDDVVRVTGDVSHTDLTFAGGGHDTLHVAGSLIDAHVTTESAYTGTLHVEAGALENAQLNLLGGTNAVTLHGNVDNLSSLVLGDGNDTLNIQGDFTGHVSMGAGNDYVTLHGNAHGGLVDGGAGNDTIIGDAGNNILVGGLGHDVLTGGAGADTFVWKAGDAGTTDAPATDVVTDFNIAEGDKLDLSGLLGEGAKDNLDNYLNVTHENGNTVLNISTTGDSASGHYDQVIVLENNNISQEQLMQQLLLTQQS